MKRSAIFKGIVIALALSVPLLIVWMGIGAPVYMIQIPVHLAIGWVLLPFENLPRMSWNGGTVLSGMLGLILATLALQFCGRRFLRSWTWRTTLTFTATLPILFFMALWGGSLVSMTRGLIREPIAMPDHSRNEFFVREASHALSMSIIGASEGEKYADRLSPIFTDQELTTPWLMNVPIIDQGEYIFPLAGLPTSVDAPIPSLISHSYVSNYRRVRLVTGPHLDSDGIDKNGEIEERYLPRLMQEIQRRRQEVLSAKSP